MVNEKMKIQLATYKDILNAPNQSPPESGGLLGAIDGCICRFLFDEGIPNERMCGYIPDTQKFNSALVEWQKENTTFAGITHTHYFGVKTLSLPDKDYIAKIIRSMPSSIEELFFPIVVMPQRELVVYKATIIDDEVLIETDDIIII